MWQWLVPLIIVVALAVIAGVYLWASYRSLSQLNAAASDSWSNVINQLQARADLLPNAVDAIKHYAPHESATFATAASSRDAALQATTPDSVAQADAQLTSVVRSLQHIASGYPQLLSSQKYLNLQTELSDAELQSQSARRAYNAAARELNARSAQFPGKLFVKRLGAETRQPLEVVSASGTGHGAPRIQF